MKIVFNKNFKELDGKTDILIEGHPISIGQWLGNKIAQMPQEDTITAIQRATAIYKGEELELTIEESNRLIGMVKNIKDMASLFMYQILNIIENPISNESKK